MPLIVSRTEALTSLSHNLSYITFLFSEQLTVSFLLSQNLNCLCWHFSVAVYLSVLRVS